MFQVQLKAWQSKLDTLEQDDPERERIERHVARLKAHDDLAALSQRDDYVSYTGTAVRKSNPDQFQGRAFIQALKSRAVATIDGVPFDQAARQIYGKTVGGLREGGERGRGRRGFLAI
jgi:hypothetical protein